MKDSDNTAATVAGIVVAVVAILAAASAFCIIVFVWYRSKHMTKQWVT